MTPITTTTFDFYHNKMNIEKETIGHLLDLDTILCTDAWRAYMTYAKEKGMEHYRTNTSKTGHVIKETYHIQNVNSYHAHFSHWIDRFKSVATKYLELFSMVSILQNEGI